MVPRAQRLQAAVAAGSFDPDPRRPSSPGSADAARDRDPLRFTVSGATCEQAARAGAD